MGDTLVRVEIPTRQGKAAEPEANTTSGTSAPELTADQRIRLAQQAAVNDYHPTETRAPVITKSTMLGRGTRTEAEVKQQVVIQDILHAMVANKTGETTTAPAIDANTARNKGLIGLPEEPEPVTEEVAEQRPQGPEDVLQAWRDRIKAEGEKYAASSRQKLASQTATSTEEAGIVSTETEPIQTPVIEVPNQLSEDATVSDTYDPTKNPVVDTDKLTQETSLDTRLHAITQQVRQNQKLSRWERIKGALPFNKSTVADKAQITDKPIQTKA